MITSVKLTTKRGDLYEINKIFNNIIKHGINVMHGI